MHCLLSLVYMHFALSSSHSQWKLPPIWKSVNDFYPLWGFQDEEQKNIYKLPRNRNAKRSVHSLYSNNQLLA